MNLKKVSVYLTIVELDQQTRKVGFVSVVQERTQLVWNLHCKNNLTLVAKVHMCERVQMDCETGAVSALS